MKKTFISIALVALVAGTLTACDSQADVVSSNLSKAAEEFEIDRRVVFYNGITDTYMLNIEGRCSINDFGKALAVTCRVGEDEYKKHYLGLSDNVSYIVEQLEPAQADVYRYRVFFRPQQIVPDIDVSTSEG